VHGGGVVAGGVVDRDAEAEAAAGEVGDLHGGESERPIVTGRRELRHKWADPGQVPGRPGDEVVEVVGAVGLGDDQGEGVGAAGVRADEGRVGPDGAGERVESAKRDGERGAEERDRGGRVRVSEEEEALDGPGEATPRRRR
jgi:hypothetical protein